MLDSSDDDDARLLVAVAAGDEAAFDLLYRRYLPVVVRWCLRETGSRELAADLSAEVFAAALTVARRYRPERGSVTVWLLGIARNKLLESRRRRRIENSARHRLGFEPIVLSDADLDRVEELASLDDQILTLLEGLPQTQRDALTGRVLQERSYEEIASELRCSASVVRQRVSRGLKTLRSQMEER
ncbi:MAG: RNA polymerase sigma factor [Solirubrobacteraceae bacterium]